MDSRQNSRRWADRARRILGGALASLLFAGAPAGHLAWAVEPSSRARAEDALARLGRAAEGTPRVVWPEGRAAPSLITGLSTRVRGSTPAARAAEFVARYQGLLGVDRSGLGFDSVRERGAQTFVRYRQTYGALPVEGAGVTFGFEGDRLVSVSNQTRAIESAKVATIDETQARLLALEFVHGAPLGDLNLAQVSSHGLALVGESAVEVYRIAVLRRPLVEHIEVLVDAHAGHVIGATDRAIR